MRSLILDDVSPASLRRAFRGVHLAIQRARMLEDFKVLGDKLVVSIDGTGLFSSTSIHRPQCGRKKRKKGQDEYYHQLLAAVVVSPHLKTVLPIDFEPIVCSDVDTRNCYERNAAKRLTPSIAQQYPKRNLIIVFREVDTKGRKREWSWITSLLITPENAFEIAAIGRSRWGTQNQVFNTLKKQGNHFEHNFGHGKKFLSSTLAGLMLLAFLSDQVQEYACSLSRAARDKTRIKTNLWAKMQTYLQDIEVPDWETLWRLIAKFGPKLVIVESPDTV